ncbi:MAG TPA: elongation factor P--(R)-beta-lysine ligase [Candidatus Ornithospirochaeta avicola]|uniref:Elongation factor P--(R)-beta-lysine ligase n=1 Tax=Candidatus Ornithospirochaeta avicola TaxID=2840896 RepID=A0A9D1PS69_9SPIO|nr:elongation factor P--(R)-beta-lysine ligase [Candidatus Ornithospirochaeta avicola]
MIDFSLQKKRSILYRDIRLFFDERNYLEVFTPTLSDTLIPEVNIKNFSTRYINEFDREKEYYLIPSPEIFMKRMLAENSGSIYQISRCFRNAEQVGQIHNPEFDMLEYYSINCTEYDSIRITEDLIRHITKPESPEYMKRKMLIMTVRSAMLEYAKADLDELQEYGKLKEKAESLGLYVPDCESWDDTFNRIFITYVEPNLPKDRPVVLTSYPRQIECLAQLEENGKYRSRWEMYINGIEIANCYREETGKEETREYYERENDRIKKQREGKNEVIPNTDSSFADLLVPPSSGVAIGLDRLLMAIYGIEDIKSVIPFHF